MKGKKVSTYALVFLLILFALAATWLIMKAAAAADATDTTSDPLTRIKNLNIEPATTTPAAAANP